MDEYLLSYLTEVADDSEGWAFVPIIRGNERGLGARCCVDSFRRGSRAP
jgi:hypothetical protein